MLMPRGNSMAPGVLGRRVVAKRRHAGDGGWARLRVRPHPRPFSRGEKGADLHAERAGGLHVVA